MIRLMNLSEPGPDGFKTIKLHTLEEKREWAKKELKKSCTKIATFIRLSSLSIDSSSLTKRAMRSRIKKKIIALKKEMMRYYMMIEMSTTLTLRIIAEERKWNSFFSVLFYNAKHFKVLIKSGSYPKSFFCIFNFIS
jgi:hypothetical protein